MTGLDDDRFALDVTVGLQSFAKSQKYFIDDRKRRPKQADRRDACAALRKNRNWHHGQRGCRDK
jgi:hypothetical protein